jgi:hypothetical protein
MNIIHKKSSLLDSLIKMAKGNPGAATVLANMTKNEGGYAAIIMLDKINIHGWKIWYGYKYYCKQDIKKFISLILGIDQDLIDFINEKESVNE